MQVQSDPLCNHVLVIEDCEDDLILLKEITSQLPFRIFLHTAKNGEDALALLNSMHAENKLILPKLILLDLNLPKLSGHEILKAIKEDKNFSRIPIIVFTTSQNPDDIQKAYQANANCYIKKPSDFDSLAHVIQKTFEFWLTIAFLP